MERVELPEPAPDDGPPGDDPDPRPPARPPESTDDAEIARFAEEARLKVTVVGCGGGGSNTVHRCVEEGLIGAQFCAVNTDVAHLLSIHAHRKILIGRQATRGRGAGSRPEIGLRAAQEGEDEIRAALAGTQIAFVTAGLGGGTGTGSAPVVARLAKEAGALTMGMVTLPFSGEGALRREVALEGLEQLRRTCDTTVVVENDQLLELVPQSNLQEAFKVADGTLASAIQGITETLSRPGLVNLDFADLRTVMRKGGIAIIGLGRSGAGANRAEEAVESALRSPLLGPFDVTHVHAALVHVIGDASLTVGEAERVVALITARVSRGAQVIWGCSVEDPTSDLESVLRVMVVLTGVRAKAMLGRNESGAEGSEIGPIGAPVGVRPPGGPRVLHAAPPPARPSPFAYVVRTGLLPAARRFLLRSRERRHAPK
ncbi:MAG: cell division protein FtsZ [Thermoplasmata archaeon]